MKTVGGILREERLRRKLSLEHVEEKTKIRKKFLLDIEADNFGNLPSIYYAKGFVKNYGAFLGIDAQYILAFFRRQIKDSPRSLLLPKGVAEPLNQSILQLTPAKFIGMTVLILTVIFLLYFFIQYQRLKQPPELVIEKPRDMALISESRIDIFGKTDPDATITINGIGVLIRTDGTFFDQINTIDGKNEITVVATSRYGKSIQKTLTVIKRSGD